MCYMGIMESRTFNERPPPRFNCRHIDDTFVVADDEKNFQNLITTPMNISKLNFTHEKSINSHLPFLDVHIYNANNTFNFSIYTKGNNTGMCMSDDSDFPKRYLARISQVLINNWFII